jgi:uncharacterized protein YkwD
MITRINALRAARGLPLLATNDVLDKAAATEASTAVRDLAEWVQKEKE